MGIEYFDCDNCGGGTNDAEGMICPNCDITICSTCFNDAEKKYGLDKDGQIRMCPSCDPNEVSDNEVTEYLLSQLGMTMNEAIQNVKVTKQPEIFKDFARQYIELCLYYGAEIQSISEGGTVAIGTMDKDTNNINSIQKAYGGDN
jgi:hypothetical protein